MSNLHEKSNFVPSRAEGGFSGLLFLPMWSLAKIDSLLVLFQETSQTACVCSQLIHHRSLRCCNTKMDGDQINTTLSLYVEVF